jgi:hypothetical protein
MCIYIYMYINIKFISRAADPTISMSNSITFKCMLHIYISCRKALQLSNALLPAHHDSIKYNFTSAIIIILKMSS